MAGLNGDVRLIWLVQETSSSNLEVKSGGINGAYLTITGLSAWPQFWLSVVGCLWFPFLFLSYSSALTLTQ
jgi:hypothetical protein